MFALSQHVSASPMAVCSIFERQGVGSIGSKPPSQSLRARSGVVLDRTYDFIDPEEIFLPFLDETASVEV